MFRKKINFKSQNLVFAALSLMLMTISCQKDDICPASTVTTPLIKVLFFDAENLQQDDAKPAVNLRVKAQDTTLALISRSTTTAFDLPLDTNADATDYEFTQYAAAANGDTIQENPPNTDLLKITYSTTEQYLNRACGFRVLYDNIEVEISDPEGETSGNWIKNISVQDSIIENETITYFFIYH